jgi:surface protein
MNIREIKEYLLSLPGADEEKINTSSRLELDRLLEIAINVKVVTPKVVYETDEDLKLDLNNTILPSVLIKIILKYTETIIKVESDDNKIIYIRQSELTFYHCKNAVNIDIYGVLVMKNPGSKFQNSKIQTISGPVVLIGSAFGMFQGAKEFNSDLSKWDTSKVDNMSIMFSHTNFNSDISNWDTSNVTNMSGMFAQVRNFNQDISKWDTSNVKSMVSMFYNAINFNQDLSGWDTSKVENIYDMFSNATKFTGSVKNIKGVWKIIYE